VTKPLIWIGIVLAVIGGSLYYSQNGFPLVAMYHAVLAIILVVNGLFLSFHVSPYLLKQEKEGNSGNLLPRSLQNKITISFLVSFFGWWGSLGLLIHFLTI